MRQNPLLQSIAAALLLAVAFAAGHAPAGEAVVIRFGFASIGVDNRQFAGMSATAFAHAEHYLEEEFKDEPDVRIEWFFFKGAGPAVNEAIANTQLDFALQGDLPSVIGRANGLKTRLLLASGAHAPTYLAIPVGSDIGSIRDLKGRRVAIFRGTNNHLAVVKILAANDLSERDLQVLNMDSATTTAALASKEIDAAFGNTPLIQVAEQGLAKIIYSTVGDNPAFERHSAVLVTDAFEAAHPQIVGRVVKALVKAARWASDESHRDALFEIWARSGTPASVYRADFAKQSLAYRNSPLLDHFLIEQYRVQAEQAKGFGLVRRDVDITGWFDPRYLDAALKELGLENFWTRYSSDGKPQAF